MFYVFETEIVDGQQAIATTKKDSIEDAKMLFHQILSSAYANKNLTYALVVIFDENGMTVRQEKILKEKPANESVPN